MAETLNGLGARGTLEVGDRSYTIYRLQAAADQLGIDLPKLPVTTRILLENLLRFEDGVSVTRDQIDAVAKWDPTEEPDTEIAFRPARVLLQDFTGVPAVVDPRGAARRDGRDGRRPEQDQPAAARRPGDRPLGAGGRFWHGRRARNQRRA